MGFSAKQVRSLRRNSITAISAPERRMAANYPISRVGTPFRKPIGSSALTAGAGRPSNPNASWPGKTAAVSWRSISPRCGSPCRPMAQPSFGKAMARVKAGDISR